MRSRPSSSHDTAYVTASTANGSQRATPYNAPPIGPPTRPATCWRAWFWLSAVGSCSRGTTVRTADISVGAKTPGGGTADAGHHQQVGERDGVEHGGEGERGVGQRAGAAGDAQQQAPVDAVREHARGQQGGGRPSSSTAPTRPASQTEPVTAKAMSGKTNMLTRVPSSLTVWPIQSTEKSRLRARARYAGHIRNIYCAITTAQYFVRNLGTLCPVTEQPRAVHDPQVLRAIAHPVRNRILTELDAQGSMRAADIARELDIPANQASFHLRQLAKYGLVEEDPAAARDKRDRVWKAVHPGASRQPQGARGVSRGKAASAVFRRNAAAWGQVVVDTVLSDRREPGRTAASPRRRCGSPRRRRNRSRSELDDVVEAWAASTPARARRVRRTYLYYGSCCRIPRPTRPTRECRAPFWLSAFLDFAPGDFERGVGSGARSPVRRVRAARRGTASSRPWCRPTATTTCASSGSGPDPGGSTSTCTSRTRPRPRRRRRASARRWCTGPRRLRRARARRAASRSASSPPRRRAPARRVAGRSPAAASTRSASTSRRTGTTRSARSGRGTGRRLDRGAQRRPEFCLAARAAGSSPRLLLQRLDEPGRPGHARTSTSAADRPRAPRCARHVALGATAGAVEAAAGRCSPTPPARRTASPTATPRTGRPDDPGSSPPRGTCQRSGARTSVTAVTDSSAPTRPCGADEATTLLTFLDYHRDTFRMKSAGLDAGQLAPPLAPSDDDARRAWSSTWRWSRATGSTTCSCGRPRSSRGPPSTGTPTATGTGTAPPTTAPRTCVALFDESVAASDAIIAEALADGGLDALSVVVSRRRGEGAFSLRWILVHMIEEYARHNGHADLIRESIDGVDGGVTR